MNIDEVIVLLEYPTAELSNNPEEYHGTATPLVRCKDCQNHRDLAGMCDVWHHHTGAMGFCHRARKK